MESMDFIKQADTVVKLQVHEICSIHVHSFEQSELDVIIYSVCTFYCMTYLSHVPMLACFRIIHNYVLYSACIRMTLLIILLSWYYILTTHYHIHIMEDYYILDIYTHWYSHCVTTFPALPTVQFLISANMDTASNQKLDGRKAW